MSKQIEPIKVFFDADVIIAGSASQTGASFLLLQLCELGLLNGITCNQVITECRRNIKKKLPQAEASFNKIIEYSLEIFNNPTNTDLEKYKNMAHQKDLPILTVALNFAADYLVSFNTKHFFPDTSLGLTVINPGELLKEIRSMLSLLADK